MRLTGKLKSVSGKEMTIELPDDVPLDQVTKLANGEQPSVSVDIEDGRTISPDQRRKIFALMRDISDWNGDTVDIIEDYMKGYTREIFALDTYSLSDCSITTASNMIYTILEFCFRNDVPFKTRTWDMIPDDYVRQWFCLRFRKCVICGKHAELAHFESVGLGRNRYKINEANFHYMALCHEHHMEQHSIGLRTFIAKYHIKPIKLPADELKKIAPYYKVEGGDEDGTTKNV